MNYGQGKVNNNQTLTPNKKMETSISKNYPKYCFYFYLAFWILLAIKPVDRFNWFLENILAVLFVVILIVSYRKIRLSNTSYTLILLFIIIHTIGAHYTYSQTPFFSELFGQKLQRDHYDRVTHFTFGLLLYYPAFDLITRRKGANNSWRFLFAFSLVVASSSLYEIFEWASALIISPDHAFNFISSQGDVFDTQKDMSLASLGALVSATATFFKCRR